MAQTRNNKKGFTILFASLFAGLLLAIGVGIFNIIFKELILASSAKESQFAFYAADSGIECALYWDLREKVFATSTNSTATPAGTLCNGDDITLSSEWNVTTGAGTGVTTFSMDFPPESYCAIVTVTKNAGDTTIESRGYNTCDTENLRRVERGLRVDY
jgi:hypothetical protein